jgi:Fic family protein
MNGKLIPIFTTMKITLTEEQAAEFIWNSNGIEEIHHDEALVLSAWKEKFSNDPELNGHIKALDYMCGLDLATKLNFKILEKLHRLLMKNLLPKSMLGLRTCYVTVGGRICPWPDEVHNLLEIWFDKVNSFNQPTEEEIWQAHLAFEFIHPFADGNGRSGRLLWLWLRFKYNYPYEVVENLTKHTDYYPQFDKFSWNKWIYGF